MQIAVVILVSPVHVQQREHVEGLPPLNDSLVADYVASLVKVNQPGIPDRRYLVILGNEAVVRPEQ